MQSYPNLLEYLRGIEMAILLTVIFGGTAALILGFDKLNWAGFHSRVGSIKDRTSVRARLNEIGEISENSYSDFRIKQLLQTTFTFLAAQLFLVLTGQAPLEATFISIAIGVFTYFYSERSLSKRVKEFRQGVDAEFPAIIEMLSLALSAGETPLAALKRVSIRAHGSLAIEFSQVIERVQTGVPFHISLDAMGRSSHSVMIRRFVDALIIAMLRGAPVIEVLQRNAQEAREAQRNQVLSAASKAEVSMMVPIVFLILPISILFALWPSLSNLNQFVG